MTSPSARTKTIMAARSVCWDTVGQETEDLSNVQCLIRASVWVDKADGEEQAMTFLDLADELAEEA